MISDLSSLLAEPTRRRLPRGRRGSTRPGRSPQSGELSPALVTLVFPRARILRRGNASGVLIRRR